MTTTTNTTTATVTTAYTTTIINTASIPPTYTTSNVFRAHIILGDVYFLPTYGKMHSLLPMEGKLKFTRASEKIYVSNNKVRAEIILANIPIANGVIHIIDNLLYYTYQNIMQKIQSMPETR
uniref:FAS1 domain-containing protein n=1 Tax=Octopus bimaculoides TaxID=37653 RepID=A0A0L8G7Q6_OCTBM